MKFEESYNKKNKRIREMAEENADVTGEEDWTKIIDIDNYM